MNESSAPSAQQRQAAKQLRATADQLQAMANKSGGQYSPAARQAAERLNSAASWLEERDVVREAREFARRRPAVVLAGAAAAVVAIRRHPVMVLTGAAAAVAARRMARNAARPSPQPDQPASAVLGPGAAGSADPEPPSPEPPSPEPRGPESHQSEEQR